MTTVGRPAGISLWLALVRPGDGERYRPLVSAAEAATGDRLRLRAARDRWFTSRALLRHVGAHLGRPLGARVLRRCAACGSDDHGAPDLGDGLYTSLAKTDRCVVVAVGDGPIGVDIESVDGVVPPSTAVFTEAERRLMTFVTAEERVARWTAKEAIGKLSGLGLRQADNTVVSHLAGARWVEASDARGEECGVRTVDVGPGLVAALAARHPAEAHTSWVVPSGAGPPVWNKSFDESGLSMV
jgi:4'-phosphopantetheinyl transferase